VNISEIIQAMIKFISKFSLVLTILLITSVSYANDKYVGKWACQMEDKGVPWGKVIPKIIKHEGGKIFSVQVGTLPKTNYTMNNFLVEDKKS